MKLYRMIEKPCEGEMVQYLAVHALRWRPEWGEPSVAFIEVDEAEKERDTLQAERDRLAAEVKRLKAALEMARKLGAAFQDLLIIANGTCEYCGFDEGNHGKDCQFANWYFPLIMDTPT